MDGTLAMELGSGAWAYLGEHPQRFWNALTVHLELSLSAVGLAAGIGIPFAIASHNYNPVDEKGKKERMAESLRSAAIAGVSAMRVIPGLAILALMIPILGTGAIPAIAALSLLALPSILLNTVAGLRQVDADTIVAARGLGLSNGQLMRKIAVPLALPAILNGLRIASVEVISGATLASFIGAGGLGQFIINGLSLYDFRLLILGAVPVALMAIAAEVLFSGLTRWTTRYRTC